MNISEAIEKINKFKSGTILYGNFSMTKSQYDDIKNAIDTVLQALENNISKDNIKEKIIELMAFELATEDENYLYRSIDDIIECFEKKAKGE